MTRSPSVNSSAKSASLQVSRTGMGKSASSPRLRFESVVSQAEEKSFRQRNSVKKGLLARMRKAVLPVVVCNESVKKKRRLSIDSNGTIDMILPFEENSED